MNIRKILVPLPLLILAVCVCAQDVIVTKDKRHIEAEVLEVSPSTIKYRLWNRPNGEVLSIPQKEVASVIYASDVESDETAEDESSKKGKKQGKQQGASERPFLHLPSLHSYLEAEGLYNTEYGVWSFGPKITVGSQLSDYVFIGGGIGAGFFGHRKIGEGIEQYPVPDGDTLMFLDKIPSYRLTAHVSLKVTIPLSATIIPYLEAEGGVDLTQRDWTEKWFTGWHYGLGVGIAVHHFTISAGYTSTVLPIDREFKPYEQWTFYRDGYENGTHNFGFIYLKVGAKIGYLKN